MSQHGGAHQPEDRGWDQHHDRLGGPPLPLPGQAGSGLPEIIPPYRPESYRPHQAGQVPVRREPQGTIETYLGEVVRTGIYPWAEVTQVNAGMATVKLDLRDVIQPGERLELRLRVWMSTVRVAVPAGTDVDLRLRSNMGDARLEIDGAGQAAPPTGARLVVTGWSLMSEVRVRALAGGARPGGGWRWTRKGS